MFYCDPQRSSLLVLHKSNLLLLQKSNLSVLLFSRYRSRHSVHFATWTILLHKAEFTKSQSTGPSLINCYISFDVILCAMSVSTYIAAFSCLTANSEKSYFLSFIQYHSNPIYDLLPHLEKTLFPFLKEILFPLSKINGFPFLKIHCFPFLKSLHPDFL